MPSDPKLFAYGYCPPSLAAGGGSRCRRSSSWLQLPVVSPEPRLLPRPLYPFVMSYDLIADSAGGLVCAIAHVEADVPAPRLARRLHAALPPAFAHNAHAALYYWDYGSKSMNDRFTLVVFNPLTSQSRTLPAPPSTMPVARGSSLQEIDPHSLMITMLTAAATSCYLVILCCHRFGAQHCSGGMVIFSSQTNSWTSVPASRFLQTTSITAGSMVDDQGWRSSHELILQADLLEWNAKKSLIMGCSLQPEVTWWELPGPSPLEPAPNAVPLFFVHRGRLLFAWLLLSGFLAIGFTIWELQPWCSTSCPDPSRMNWVVLAETPGDMRRTIGGSEEEEEHKTDPPADYKLMHSGSLVCLMIANFSDEIRDHADEKYFLASLTYDLDRGSWSRLPPVNETAELGMLFIGSFCFQPNFTATV